MQELPLLIIVLGFAAFVLYVIARMATSEEDVGPGSGSSMRYFWERFGREIGKMFADAFKYFQRLFQ